MLNLEYKQPERILNFVNIGDHSHEALGKNGVYRIKKCTYASLYPDRNRYNKRKPLNYSRHKLEYKFNDANGYSKLGEYKDFITAIKTAENYELRMNKRAA
jgi:hypothetical protein